MDLSGGHCSIVAALLAALLAVGCAGVKQSDTPSAPAVAPAAPTTPVAPGAAAVAAPTAPAATAPPPQPAASPAPPGQAAAKPAVKPGAAAAPPSAKAAPVAKAAPPPLDLKALETELRETKAIGVMTKLSLKNQVDDLLSQFRAFYQGKLKTTLAELRRPFDLLVLKLLSLLQDSDPALAAAIVMSREAIWGILSDRAKFASLDGG
jgi:hypothetical protein